MTRVLLLYPVSTLFLMSRHAAHFLIMQSRERWLDLLAVVSHFFLFTREGDSLP